MALRATELIFTIATVALILTHAQQFTTVIGGTARSYQTLVKGLQGR